MVLSFYKKIQTSTKVSQPVLIIKVIKINMELMHKERVLVIPIAAHDLPMLKVCISTSRVRRQNQYM